MHEYCRNITVLRRNGFAEIHCKNKTVVERSLFTGPIKVFFNGHLAWTLDAEADVHLDVGNKEIFCNGDLVYSGKSKQIHPAVYRLNGATGWPTTEDALVFCLMLTVALFVKQVYALVSASA